MTSQEVTASSSELRKFLRSRYTYDEKLKAFLSLPPGVSNAAGPYSFKMLNIRCTFSEECFEIFWYPVSFSIARSKTARALRSCKSNLFKTVHKILNLCIVLYFRCFLRHAIIQP